MTIQTETSLTLKWRPKTLSQVIGQEVVTTSFANAFKNKKLHHAYVLAGNLGSGKCITGDSIVFTPNGSNEIKNIVSNTTSISKLDIAVVAEDGVSNTVAGYFKTNEKTFKITTNEGYSLEGTPEHPIRIMDKHGSIVWKALKDIIIGDYACIYRDEDNFEYPEISLNTNKILEKYLDEKFPKESEILCNVCGSGFGNISTHVPLHNLSLKEYTDTYKGSRFIAKDIVRNSAKKNMKKVKIPKILSKDLARMLGYLVAEGCSNNNVFSFYNKDDEVIKDFINLTKKIFKINPKIEVDSRGLKKIGFNSVLISYFLKTILGIRKSAKKIVPNEIFQSPNYIVAEFLKGYFEGDGYSFGSTIGCGSSSYNLIKQIQILLLRFGIVSYLKVKNTKKLSYVDKGYQSWNLSIYSNNMKLFKEKIGMISSRKNKEMLKVCCHKKINPNKNIIPHLQEISYKIWKSLELTQSGKLLDNNNKIICTAPRYPQNCKPNNIAHQNLTYDNLSQIINYFKDIYNIFINNSSKLSKKNIGAIDTIYSFIKHCEYIYNKNYFYSKVVEKSIGTSDVYDICKSGNDKSFIANGFINHNTSVSRIIAAMENCEKGPSLEPCGVCKNCSAIFVGKSNDVREMNAASNRGIDDIRAIVKDIQYAPIDCRVKYVILDEAHSLSGHAAECALKPIEEPPPNVRFILCTTSLGSLLDTIQSRCIVHRFNKVNWQLMFEHIKMVAQAEKINSEDEALRIAAKAAQGSVRNSLRNLQMLVDASGGELITKDLASQTLGLVDNNLYFHFIDAISKVNAPKGIKIIEKIFRDGKEAGLVLEGLLNHLHILMLASNFNTEDLGTMGYNEDESKKYQYQAQMLFENEDSRTNMLVKMVGLAGDAQRGISMNLDPQIMMERYLLECIMTKKQLSIK